LSLDLYTIGSQVIRAARNAAWVARMPWYKSTLIRARGVNAANREQGERRRRTAKVRDGGVV
jgi:hypothetical protein